MTEWAGRRGLARGRRICYKTHRIALIYHVLYHPSSAAIIILSLDGGSTEPRTRSEKPSPPEGTGREVANPQTFVFALWSRLITN
ncbi:hypothetical protein L596_008408 [Steinernema carpocapsae]|uniref:Uncharacterized protein n=1 Tax=Steinernema carpocapsae TaxID=34508 RepID=A0A4U5PCD9_STECR|nr:hypothetical protein L596_008408 [Steinernema carpocapsae]